MRAVRIFRLLTPRVMLAMHGGPFLGDLARRQPQPQPEEVRGEGMQTQRTVRLMPMQKHGDADHRDMRHGQREQDHLPPVQVPGTLAEEINQGIEKRAVDGLHR